MTLLLAEISKKQSYIFNSIYPKDIVGASIIIRKLTQGNEGSDTSIQDGVQGGIQDGVQGGVQDDVQGDAGAGAQGDAQDAACAGIQGDAQGDANKLFAGLGGAGVAKKVYSGGGGFLLEFKNREKAIAWNKAHSRAILENYPGIQYVSVVEDDANLGQGIRERIKILREKIAEKKNSRDFSFKLTGLGVEEPCIITGDPADAYGHPNTDGKESNVSKELVVKQCEYDIGVAKYYESLLSKGFTFPNEKKVGRAKKFGEFIGNSDGERSLIGLVSIDGNKMGKKIKQWLDNAEDLNDDEYIKRYNDFTGALDKVYRSAMKHLVKKMGENLDNLKASGMDIKDKEIPIIHIVLSGDDVSFVVDGRIAISAAVVFLRGLKQAAAESPGLNKLNMNFNACAGIAIAKDGFPYWKMAEIAEELQKHAKGAVANADCDACVLDWQVLGGSIHVEPNKRSFSARPYVLKETISGEANALDNATDFSVFLNELSKLKNAEALNENHDEEQIANSVMAEIYRLLPNEDKLNKYIADIKDEKKQNAVNEFVLTSNRKALADALSIKDIYVHIEGGKE
ncbi:MAG: hypothetical protein LBG97_08015 [Coriobacteriales bacterium]|jgi:hypothetical protein|nr:hypothetical protein [Coriobacteriales bacterium]